LKTSFCKTFYYLEIYTSNAEWPKFRSNRRGKPMTQQQVKFYKCKNNICQLLKAKSHNTMSSKSKRNCKKWQQTALKPSYKHETHIL